MSDERVETETGAATRRGLLVGAGAAGAAAVLAACGTDDSGSNPYLAPPAASDPPAEPTSTGTPTDAASATPDEGGGEDEGNADGLVATADIEVGGGVILENEGIVITQPAAEEWRGFTSTCTHQGCPVTSVSDGTINCNCHGSKFSIQDGSVVNGPAPEPLEERAVAVEDGWVVLA